MTMTKEIRFTGPDALEATSTFDLFDAAGIFSRNRESLQSSSRLACSRAVDFFEPSMHSATGKITLKEVPADGEPVMAAERPSMPTSADELIPTRRSLLSRLKDWEDQESWREFFNIYWRLIYGVALKAGLSDAEAQDVVQDTVIAVARRMQEFKYDPAIGSFKNWLLVVTRRRIADHQRKQCREPFLAEHGAWPTTETAAMERIPAPIETNIDAIWDREW